jgi:two-component system chemotaxis response regulator CheB
MSAGDAYPGSTLGIILTGANDDGSRGLRHIVNRGGKAIVQDPATAESKAMPAAALQAVPEAEVMPLGQIAPRLVSITASMNGRGPEKR